ncbi:hypothetical protein BGZ90_010265 [Linnemannia elongata]|nr:hypothetical protein BGZ90_010265 [Linnemannia elongata]
MALIAQGVLVTNYFGFSQVSEQNYVTIITGVLDPNIYRGGATTPANLNITYPTILDQLKARTCHSPFNMIFNLRGTPECLSAIGT